MPQSRNQIGIFWGFSIRTWDYIIGTPRGAVMSGQIHRFSEGERYNVDLFRSCRGVTWCPIPGSIDGGGAKVYLKAESEVPSAALPEPPEEPQPPQAKRVFIRRKVELEKRGIQ